MSDPSFDAERNILQLGEQRLVFHCHHYNVFLQRSVTEMLGDDAIQVQISAAAESARRMLSKVLDASDFAGRLDQAARVFATNGFGCAELDELTPEGGRVRLLSSHYAIGWRAKLGPAKAPVCHFAAGFWRGALVVAAGLDPERVTCSELCCHAVTGEPCELGLEVW